MPHACCGLCRLIKSILGRGRDKEFNAFPCVHTFHVILRNQPLYNMSKNWGMIEQTWAATETCLDNSQDAAHPFEVVLTHCCGILLVAHVLLQIAGINCHMSTEVNRLIPNNSSWSSGHTSIRSEVRVKHFQTRVIIGWWSKPETIGSSSLTRTAPFWCILIHGLHLIIILLSTYDLYFGAAKSEVKESGHFPWRLQPVTKQTFTKCSWVDQGFQKSGVQMVWHM